MSSSTSLSPPWLDLPRDITAMILNKLGALQVLAVAQNVCTTWRSVCRDPSMWRSIDIGDNNVYDFNNKNHLHRMYRRAVDLSQGQLADITLRLFCDGGLLIYISERCPRLRRLELVDCYDIDEASLSAALQNLPLLEELHFLHCTTFIYVDTTAISCPLLKSFKLHTYYSSWTRPQIVDRDAEWISRTMPELRHLELIGNRILNDGLRAILDGCPHLETLDLRGCDDLDFTGDVEEACTRRIKGLRRPDDAWSDDDDDRSVDDQCCSPRWPTRFSAWSYGGDSVHDDYENYQLPGGIEDSPADCDDYDYEDCGFCDTRGALKREAGARPSLRRTQEKKRGGGARAALRRPRKRGGGARPALRRPQKTKGGARPALRRPRKHSSSARRALRREAQHLDLRS